MNDLSFEWEAENGQRLHRYFIWIKIMKTDTPFLWFSDKRKRWVTELNGDGGSDGPPCRTFKAFKSHIRRHRKDLKGCKLILVNRYQGYNITVQL